MVTTGIKGMQKSGDDFLHRIATNVKHNFD